jgi:hypothetical protein
MWQYPGYGHIRVSWKAHEDGHDKGGVHMGEQDGFKGTHASLLELGQ